MAEVTTPAELKAALADSSVKAITLADRLDWPAISLSGRSDFTLASASLNPRACVLDGKRKAPAALLARQCPGLQVRGIGLTRGGRGLRVTESERLTVAFCVAWDTGAEGYNTGLCDNQEFADCDAWDTAANWVMQDDRGRDFYATKAHGFYLGTDYRGAKILRCRTWDTSGMGVHINGTVGEGWARDVLIEDCDLRRALLGKGVGAPALQFCATAGAVVRRTYIGESNGGATLHGEGDPRWAARNVTLEDCCISQAEGKFALNLMDGAALDIEGRSVVVGRVTGTVRYDPATQVFARLDTAARAALQAWQQAGSGAVEPGPVSPDIDIDALRAQVAELLAERDGLRLRVARLEADRAQIHALSTPLA